MTQLNPFHLAFPVDDLNVARDFYIGVLGATEGRSSNLWIDFNLFGQHIVAHLIEKAPEMSGYSNPVDGDNIPIPHFGVVLPIEQWNYLKERIKSKGWQFQVEPKVRFSGTSGEQWSMFLKDPSGNSLEFKSFLNPEKLFEK